MIFLNPNWFLAMILSAVIFYYSRQFLFRYQKYPFIFLTGSILLFLSSLILPLAYIGDTLTNIPIYCHWRTLPFSELLVCLGVPLFAVGSVCFRKQKIRQSAAGRPDLWKENRYAPYLFLIFSLIYISSIFIKPLIRPLKTYTAGESWVNDVCIQSAPSTCGPASLATLIRTYQPTLPELEIAKNAYTCGTGTEIWYLTRFARKQGFDYRYVQASGFSEIRLPAIIGVTTPFGYGHFVTLLENDEGLYYVGDPIKGDLFVTEDEFSEHYTFTGFAVSIYKD